MAYILFDGNEREALLPFTYTRPVSEIRIGILTIKEKWERMLNTMCSYQTQQYLSKKYTLHASNSGNYWINGAVLPNIDLIKQINNLTDNEGLFQEELLMAAKTATSEFNKESKTFRKIEYAGEIQYIRNVWDIFSKNGSAIINDFNLITKGRSSSTLSTSNTLIGNSELLFIEEGAIVEASILNTTSGPIYIGKDAEVMEGSIVRGPFALCEHSALKLGAKIYGPTTIGPYSKVGGEVNNSVIFGYSNKGHDGFLGNSVLGEWCNLGADTNNSNLKNNYSQVKIWDYQSEEYINTRLQFCGLIMGDHSKSGINTMFNTGTVVGVSANIFGSGFPSKHIPSFGWGGADGFSEYRLSEALEVAERVFERRSMSFDQTEKEILEEVFKQSSKYRS